MHSVTDRQTDRRQDYANSRSYCVAVRPAKNEVPDVTRQEEEEEEEEEEQQQQQQQQ